MALVNVLKEQYASLENHALAGAQIEAIKDANTFTICTAHQPNIFGGPLYCIYKVVSAIKLAQSYQKEYPQYHFIPVYYIGSEDHDLAELNHIQLFQQTLTWNTNQTGSVGRMKAEGMEHLLVQIEQLVGQEPHAKELLQVLQDAYVPSKTIAQATAELFHFLFADHGLLVLNPDHPQLKTQFITVIEKELKTQFSFSTLSKSNAIWEKKYESQVHARAINLFYLVENSRERIVAVDERFELANQQKQWSVEELLFEVKAHPERFSPNVVLRPLYQETILPNVAFVGGGSEVAYWLQQFPLFKEVNIPFPLIYLRNSALILNKNQSKKIKQLNWDMEDLFKPAADLIKAAVLANRSIDMEQEKEKLTQLSIALKEKSVLLDQSLIGAAEATAVQLQKLLEQLEKKWLQTEKRKQEEQINQIQQLKDKLFPNDSLQERTANFISYYAKYGKLWIVDLMTIFEPSDFKFSVVEEN
jgi:bacillithiol biosynthesis cysteine-adding enzyme BshC